MMTKIFGGLCCVSFALTSVAHLAEQSPDVERKVAASSTVYCGLAQQDQPKAISLIAVTSKTCGPCKKLKAETLPVLAKEGYNVQWISFRNWDGPSVDRVPTLFYMDSNERIINSLTEVGFRTPAQIKKKLRKP